MQVFMLHQHPPTFQSLVHTLNCHSKCYYCLTFGYSVHTQCEISSTCRSVWQISMVSLEQPSNCLLPRKYAFYMTSTVTNRNLWKPCSALWCKCSATTCNTSILYEHSFESLFLFFQSNSLLIHVGKHWSHHLSTLAPTLTWETWMELQAPGFVLAQPQILWPFE